MPASDIALQVPKELVQWIGYIVLGLFIGSIAIFAKEFLTQAAKIYWARKEKGDNHGRKRETDKYIEEFRGLASRNHKILEEIILLHKKQADIMEHCHKRDGEYREKILDKFDRLFEKIADVAHSR